MVFDVELRAPQGSTSPGVLLLLGVSTIAIILFLCWSFLIDPLGLRRFPCPSLMAFTPFWLMYHNAKFNRFRAVDEAHRRLGPIVRISYNHLSFSDPRAFKEIYNYGSKLVKADFYVMVGGSNPSMAQTIPKAEHSAKRRNLSHVFSAQQIGQMEPRIKSLTRKLCDKIQIKSQGRQVGKDDQYPVVDGTFDLRPWLNMFAYDAITWMFWSNSYGFLDKGNDLCSAELPSGERITVNAMKTFQTGVHFTAWLSHLPPFWYRLGRKLLHLQYSQQAGGHFSSMARLLVKERLDTDVNEPDLFSSLPVQPSEKRPVPMSFNQIHAECGTMLDAGSDTTQTSLTNCIYQLARHPSKQQKLRNALFEVIPGTERPVTSYYILQNVPYLRACLDESFRCRPPVGIGLPRKVIEPDVVISGHRIFPGTTVSAPLYGLHLDESLFSKAGHFIPERWLLDNNETSFSDLERENLKSYVLPFSLGSRACIGRNLAYMELSIVISSLIIGFEWELATPDWEMPTVERFNSNPKELIVRARAIN